MNKSSVDSEQFIRKRLKSKTYWLGFFAMLFGLLQAHTEWVSAVTGLSTESLLITFGIGSWVIRELTKGPVNEK